MTQIQTRWIEEADGVYIADETPLIDDWQGVDHVCRDCGEAYSLIVPADTSRRAVPCGCNCTVQFMPEYLN